jgi:hypothetical protein
MAFTWRPRPKPVKTKTTGIPTPDIREAGTSLGELVPVGKTDEEIAKSLGITVKQLQKRKTGLASTPDGKESVKRILTGPEMGRRTFNKGLMGVLHQLFFPTSMPKLSKTKAPVPVPKAKTTLSDWNTMKEDLEEIVDNQINLSSDELLDDLSMKFEDEFHESRHAYEGWDFGSYTLYRTEEVVKEIVHDIMNWKVRENPKLIQDLINNWKKAAKIQSHEPGMDQLEIGELNYQDNIAERVQELIEQDLMTGFDKYRDTEKYNENWFKKTAKNLERIPNSPPPFKTSHEMFIHNSNADARMDQIPDNPSPSETKQTTSWGGEDYRGTGKIQELPVEWRNPTKPLPLEDHPITRKIIDDSFVSAINRLGRNWFEDTVESNIKYESEAHLPLRRNYLVLSGAKGLGPLPKKLKKEISEGDLSITGPDATKYVTDKELKYLDDLFNKFAKGYELPEDLLVSFANAPHQYTQTYRKVREAEPDIFKRIPRPKGKFGTHYEINKTDAAHPYLVPVSDVEYIKEREEYRKVQEAANKWGIHGDTLLQVRPTKEELRKKLEDSGYKKEIIEDVLNKLFTTKGLSSIADKITEVQTTPDPVTKGLSSISDDITNKITEVQTTPDPVTGAIDKTVTKLQDETEFQDQQAQKARTVKDIKDAFLSRRQLLFPRKKNTGGLVGLYY